MDILEKIFNSRERVQIMRFFIFNPDIIFGVNDIFTKTGVSKRIIDSELHNLERAGLLRRKPYFKGQKDLSGDNLRGRGWILNSNFRYLKALENLIISQGLISEQELLRKISSWGKIKFVLISGIFTQNEESRVDVMVVGDNIRNNAVVKSISNLEKEFGKEIRYSVFETGEFKYRLNMHDKLVHDIVDYSHKTLINRLNWPGLS
jgi:hypothetical protein